MLRLLIDYVILQVLSTSDRLHSLATSYLLWVLLFVSLAADRESVYLMFLVMFRSLHDEVEKKLLTSAHHFGQVACLLLSINLVILLIAGKVGEYV